MTLDRLTKIDGGGISTTSDYRVGIITATKFVGPIEGDLTGSITATDGTFSGNVTIGGTLSYEDVTNIDSVGLVTARDGIFLPDNKKLQFGNAAGSADLEIFHSSSENKTIIDNNTNDLDIASDVIRLKNSARSETLATFINNAGVSLYYDNSIKLGTAGWGIQATGILKIADATDSSGATNHLALGASNDLKLFHDGSHNRIHSSTGFLDINNSADLISITASNRIDISDDFIRLRSRDGSDVYMTGTVNSSVDLYFNNNKRFTTSNYGVDLFGQSTAAQLRLKTQEGTNRGMLWVNNSNHLYISDAQDHTILRGIKDGACELYHDNVKRLETSSVGVSIPQDLDVDGHTNLDNVSIAGVTTITGSGNALDVRADNFTKAVFQGTGSNSSNIPFYIMSGNSATQIGNHPSGSEETIIFNSASNFISFETNDTERLRITSDGKIGVGNFSSLTARANLHIHQPDSSGSFLRFTNSTSGTGTSDGAEIGLDSDEGLSIFNYENDYIRFGTNSNERLRITSDGNLILKDDLGQGNSLVHYIRVNDSSGNSQYQLGMVSSGNEDLYLIQSRNANLRFQTSGSSRWLIDGDPGHLLPAVAGAVDIGSASAEIRHLYLGDSGHVKLGSDQDTQVFHDGSNFYIKNDTGNIVLKNAGADYLRAISTDSSVALLQNSGIKLQTTATGITVTGEVASSQNYPNVRPLLDFNFAATKKLDTRLDYIRKGVASFVNEFGKVVLVGDNVPRFDHDPDTRESKGLLIEESRTNLYTYSSNLSSDVGWGNTRITVTVNTTTTPDKTNSASTLTVNSAGSYAYAYDDFTTNNGTSYALSGWFKYINCQYVWLLGGEATDLFAYFDIQNGTIGTTNGYDCTITAYPDGWYRCTATRTKTGSTGSEQIGFGLTRSNNNPTNNQVGDAVYAWGAQQEVGAFPTSYIPTNGSSATREKDELTMSGSDLRDVFNDLEGTMFYEASVTDLTNDNQPIVAFRDNQNATGNEIPMGFAIGGSNPSIRTWIRSYVTGSQVNSFLTAHTSTGIAAGKPYKHMMAFKKDDFADSYNTGANSGQLTSSSGNMPTAGSIDELRFGQYYAYASQAKTYGLDSGHIKRFSYWPQRLTNTQLTTYIS